MRPWRSAKTSASDRAGSNEATSGRVNCGIPCETNWPRAFTAWAARRDSSPGCYPAAGQGPPSVIPLDAASIVPQQHRRVIQVVGAGAEGSAVVTVDDADLESQPRKLVQIDLPMRLGIEPVLAAVGHV